jgi:catechol 2,3-dioxygenase-like lactoylglutathione lyase family enzyme
VGVRTDRVAEMRQFALDVLGFRVGEHDSERFVELFTADGSRLELFGEGAGAPGQFSANTVVAGFLVDDIHAARAELERTAGVELLGEVETVTSGYSWQHFRAPDGHIYELTMNPDAAS